MTATALKLENYDFAVLVDRSGSMGAPYQHGTRFSVAQETVEAIARKAATFDDDGITVGFFNQNVTIQKNVTPEALSKVFQENEPSGSTNTAQALKDVLATKSPDKPLLVVVLTDGEPNDRQAVIDVLVNAANGIARDEELAFQFIQVGDDASATAFLKHLDDSLSSAKFDIVDTTNLNDVDNIVELLEKTIND